MPSADAPFDNEVLCPREDERLSASIASFGSLYQVFRMDVHMN